MVIRFDKCELDSRRQQLTREGRVVKLERIPLNLLFLLASSQGVVVTRQAIVEHLWGHAFVDAQHSINTAINKLRTALGDDLAEPRFIQTVKGMGYRWVARVEMCPDRESEAESVASAERAAGTTTTVATPGRTDPPAAAARNAAVWRFARIGVPLVLVGLVAAGGLLYRSHRHESLTAKDTIVLADFGNTTGDPVFDDTLKTALGISLRQSPFLNVLPESQFANTLKLMAFPADTKLTPKAMRELCQRAGSKAYVAGSIVTLGSQYVIGLKAINCLSGDTLAEEQMTVPSKERVLDALGDAASKLRGELGESLASVRKFDIPLEQATTSSLEALEAYSKSYAREVSVPEGIAYLQRAIALDPNFAMAYANVGSHYVVLGEIGRAREFYAKAFDLRNHASERERLEISADYYQYVTGELDKAIPILEQNVESYPGSVYLNLGNVYAQLGRYEAAADTARQYLRLAPELPAAYVNLATFSLALQRPDEANDTIRAARARKLDIFLFHLNLYAVAFQGSNAAAMAEEQQWFAGRPSETYALALASDTAAYHGRLRQARELTRRAVDAAIRVDDKENGALWRAIAAQREAAFGNGSAARQLADEALELAPDSQGVSSEAALAFALAGDKARAESLAQALQILYPLDTQLQSLWLPSIKGRIATQSNDPSSAVHALQSALPIELGQTTFTLNISCLYPAYLRGEAYLARGDGRAAAAEFQKILEHSGIVWNCWTGALAHLGIARANALQSKTSQGADADAARVRALAAYKDFLALWKEADPDIPILKQAKAEYAKLQ